MYEDFSLIFPFPFAKEAESHLIFTCMIHVLKTKLAETAKKSANKQAFKKVYVTCSGDLCLKKPMSYPTGFGLFLKDTQQKT